VTDPTRTPDPSRQDPLAFLEALTRTDRPYAVAGVAPLKDWIRPEHLPVLLERLASKRPAAPVVSTISSVLPRPGERSSEGREAAYLIEGFRRGMYPPTLTSVSPYFDPESPEAYGAWWQGRSEET
jgi:hypothetical protein